MRNAILALYALPPVLYAAIYLAYCLKRKKIKAAIGICSLSLLALLCCVMLALEKY